jgi:uncharacterized membrane protein YkoI
MAFVALLSIPSHAQSTDTNSRAGIHGTSPSESLAVEEAYPGLLQRAKVRPDSAVEAALAKVKNGRLVSTAIEDRGSRLVYVIRVEERGGRTRELLVDAETGRVLSNRKLPRNQE